MWRIGMAMESLLGESCKQEHEYTASPLNSTPLSHSDLDREHSMDEEKLSQVLIERVLPPFSKSMKLRALVVYQADREKMNCLLVNRNYEKLGSQQDPTELELCPDKRNGLDGLSDLSDSGYLDSTKLFSTSLTPQKPTTNEEFESCESIDSNHTMSRRKRKLCRPCKIPQNGPANPESLGSAMLGEAKVPKIASSTATVIPPNSNNITSATSTTTTTTTTATSSNEVISFTSKSISDSVLLPVTAVTLLPRVSVFSLPVTVISTLPRPILPRISHDKPTITVTTIPATSMLPTSTALNQPMPPNRSSELAGTVQSESTKISSAHTTTTHSNVVSDPSNRRFGKSFLCNQCRQDFSSLNLLCAHTFAVHKCFRCTICGAQFTQRSNLQRHSLRHVGFKPFICKVCDKAYYRKDHLVRHIELSHPGRDPRLSLTVKLSSAECLDYLERLQSEGNDIEQVHMLCHTSDEAATATATRSPTDENRSTEEAELVDHTSPEKVVEEDTQ